MLYYNIMSAQYLQQSIPNESQTIKVNDCTIRGNLVVEGSTTVASEFIASGLKCASITLNGDLSFPQQTSITTTVDARASSDTFEIATVAKTLTAGETVQFDVLQSNLDGRENIIVSMSGYSGSFLADGTPIVFLQKIDSGNNKFTVGIKNIAVSQSTGSQVYVLRVTVIRGST